MPTLTGLQFELLSALARGPRHGYALVADVEVELGKRPGVATVYAALEKLHVAALIAPADDEIVDGRLRRYFRITERGVETLASEADRIFRRARLAKRRLRTTHERETPDDR